MSYDDRYLNATPSAEGVLGRRIIAYFVDLVVIAAIWLALSVIAGILTVISFGLLHAAWAVVPLSAVIYSVLTIGGPHAATWGMRLMGLTYRRLEGGYPDYLTALILIVLFYVSVSITGGLILLLALFTRHNRTLHDIVTDLVLVRRDAGWHV